jgi:predicted nucleotidyltransferase component of viral defense system
MTNELNLHEQFELEVLDLLNREGFLKGLVFGGGTCLRLCYGLNRYSIDLDFWATETFSEKTFEELKKVLKEQYELTDFKEKYFTFLLECRSKKYPRRLKLEIRRELPPHVRTELAIAFSPASGEQVKLTAFTLKQMSRNKIAALLERGEIRDAYDLEFLFKKGAWQTAQLSQKEKAQMKSRLAQFKPRDFKVTLGSLLSPEERDYYNENGFKILINALRN